MKQKFFIIGLFLSATGQPNARGQSITPSILNATGGTATTSGGTVIDWSVGEMTMVSTINSPSVIITQGLLQPADNGTTEINSTSLVQHLLVFPNPANSVVNLQYTSSSAGLLAYRLMDIAGKIILNSTAEIKQGVTTEQLNISNLAAATYILEVFFKADGMTQEMTSYKIEKLK